MVMWPCWFLSLQLTMMNVFAVLNVSLHLGHTVNHQHVGTMCTILKCTTKYIMILCAMKIDIECVMPQMNVSVSVRNDHTRCRNNTCCDQYVVLTSTWFPQYLI